MYEVLMMYVIVTHFANSGEGIGSIKQDIHGYDKYYSLNVFLTYLFEQERMQRKMNSLTQPPKGRRKEQKKNTTGYVAYYFFVRPVS
jgi:hypothetical protein